MWFCGLYDSLKTIIHIHEGKFNWETILGGKMDWRPMVRSPFPSLLLTFTQERALNVIVILWLWDTLLSATWAFRNVPQISKTTRDKEILQVLSQFIVQSRTERSSTRTYPRLAASKLKNRDSKKYSIKSNIETIHECIDRFCFYWSIPTNITIE